MRSGMQIRSFKGSLCTERNMLLTPRLLNPWFWRRAWIPRETIGDSAPPITTPGKQLPRRLQTVDQQLSWPRQHMGLSQPPSQVLRWKRQWRRERGKHVPGRELWLLPSWQPGHFYLQEGLCQHKKCRIRSQRVRWVDSWFLSCSWRCEAWKPQPICF